MPEEASTEPVDTTATSSTEAAAADANTATTDPTPKPAETVEFWKSKAREQEKRAKENAAKAVEFDKVTESQKSELQKALERAEAAEKAATTLQDEKQQAQWRSDASKATEGRVPPGVLRGSTQEEIEAHAAELVAMLPDPQKQPFDHGTRSTSAEPTMNDLIFGAAKRR